MYINIKLKVFNENEELSIWRFKCVCIVMLKKVNLYFIGFFMNGLEFDKYLCFCWVMIFEVGLYF